MSIRKNLLYNISLKVVNILYPLITVPYISRVLGADGVGLSGFANSYAGYFVLVAALGIPTYGIREIARVRHDRKNRDRVFSELFSINIVSAVVLSALYLLSVYFIPMLYADLQVMIVAGIVLYFSAFNIDWFFAGIEDFRQITIRSVIVKLVFIALLFVFVRNRADVVAYVLLVALSTVLNQLWNYAYLLKTRVKIRFSAGTETARHLKPVFILLGSTVAASVYTMLDSLMLGFMSDYDQVGYYSSAVKVSHVLLAVITAVGTVFLPALSLHVEQKNVEKVKYLLQKSTSFMAFVAVPLSVGIMLFAPEFVPWFFGSEFIPATTPFRIMSGILVAVGISNILGIQILLPYGHDKLFLYALVLGALSNFCLNLFLIPVLGATGAAVASLLAETLISVSMWAMVRNKIREIRFDWRYWRQAFLASVLFIPIYFLLKPFAEDHPLWFMAVFTIVCMAEYLLVQAYVFRNHILPDVVSALKNNNR